MHMLCALIFFVTFCYVHMSFVITLMCQFVLRKRRAGRLEIARLRP